MRFGMVRGMASLFGLSILLVFIWYGSQPRIVLQGATPLIIGSCLALVGLLHSVRLPQAIRSDRTESELEVHFRRASVLVLCGIQIAGVGLLSIWAIEYHGGSAFFPASYIVAVVFVICSYKLVSIMDDPHQRGGAMPLNYFGRPRSRRILFCGLLCSPIGLLALADAIIVYSWKWCPVPFWPPQLCLLILALTAAIVLAMAAHRYYRTASRNGFANAVLAAILIGTLCNSALQLSFAQSIYVALLSACSIVLIGATMYWLLADGYTDVKAESDQVAQVG